MSYATEAEYRAAIVAYRALHDVFYRFHKSVCAEQHSPEMAEQQHGKEPVAATEREVRRNGRPPVACSRQVISRAAAVSSTGSRRRSASSA